MLIPKKNRFGLALRGQDMTITTGNKTNRHYHWSEVCADFIKEVVFRKRNSVGDENSNQHFSKNSNSNLCRDQPSEFQRSYVSFPELIDSDNESDNDSCHTNNASSHSYWVY